MALGLVQVPEAEKVFTPLTVLENLELGAYLRRLDSGTLNEEMEKVFDSFPSSGSGRVRRRGRSPEGSGRCWPWGRR